MQSHHVVFAFIVAIAVQVATAKRGFALRGREDPTLEEWKEKQANETGKVAAKAAKESKMSAVNKVTELMEDLKSQVMKEGEEEAHTYSKFACWCKDTTNEKTDAIKAGEDEKGVLEGDIGSLQSTRNDLDVSIAKHTKSISDKEDDKRKKTGTRQKEMKVYDSNAADLTGAIHALEGAIKSLKASKTSLIQAPVLQTVRTALQMADAMGLGGSTQAARNKLTALLQAGPDVPMEDYKFHSGDIIGTLEKLLDDFRAEKVATDKSEVDAASAHDIFLQDTANELTALNVKLADDKKKKATTQEEIEVKSQQLSSTSATILDDQEYLTETAQICSDKAKTWDQRSALRAGELTTLTQVIHIITNTVSEKTSAATLRLAQGGVSVRLAKAVASSDAAMEAVEASVEAAESTPVNFLQQSSGKPSSDGARSTVVDLLRKKGDLLHSAVLASLAGQISKDPFGKIKTLIQELIERLMKEAANESDQKAWCDKATTDAEQKRDYAAREVLELNGRMSELESDRDKLTLETAELTDEMKKLNKELDDATKIRGEEKSENEATVKEAEEGETAIDLAIDIVAKFYKTSKKATVDLSYVQQPADDAPDAGFNNGEAYTGAQGEAGGILGMMDVMKSDFARTIAETEAAERAAVDEFLSFKTENRKSHAEKDSQHSLKDEMLSETKTKLSDATDDLGNQNTILLDKIEELLKLKPVCVDTGMSYADRVARRREEIDALENALCILKAYEEFGPDGLANAC